MTRQFFLKYLMVAFFVACNFNAAPSLNSYKKTNIEFKTAISNISTDAMNSMESGVATLMMKRASLIEELTIKKTEELAKIHRFHKERVKNHKKHGHKFWIMSKLLLIICHITILLCAFLDLVH